MAGLFSIDSGSAVTSACRRNTQATMIDAIRAADVYHPLR